ncbi:MAG: hypothetical protein DWB56_06845 [Candidatus Jettenia sp.]|uniref:Uncharacterized protein n=1 Tax=Candidatus Jettenia caeni TaxID=247490 RepID=I3IMY2_9BACT|nr:hypothetical protein [Candidatus Jettenia sp. AMX1]MBC6928671.1 hypothetical protein [Candidatus Jettenia sp.]GAB63077.1 conserved hypothetical protein [Candidatus Jettenia caeni]KAA0250649.1 MAG: hypothetical protein EDM77_03785 [Candidatus Jettenia sp. AMX1]MCE7879983.1 hypothetical protein [Candidatus Jettenia sp. AMX1]MCQ3926765.1 hypothetical protein [Candidatus Jettenia sp.]
MQNKETLSCCTENTCHIPVNPQEAQNLAEIIRERIKCKLNEFIETVELMNDVLEIDGISIDNEPCQEITERSRIKILNHKREDAVEVEIDTIIKTPLEILIPSLITGETEKLIGVTRIVGYYSRVQNWNKSKIGELRDRHKGNYAVGRQG